MAVRLAVVNPIYKIFRLSCISQFLDFSLIELFTSFFAFESKLYIHVYKLVAIEFIRVYFFGTLDLSACV